MSYRYIVLGAGMQGTAVAYDMAKFGEAQQIILADIDLRVAQRAAHRVNRLTRKKLTKAAKVDVKDHQALVRLLKGSDVVLSAVPYYFNVGIAKAAIEARTNMCDLGGSTDIVFEQLKLDRQARRAGITIVPDCGLMPGMGNTLAVYGMSKLKRLGTRCKEVHIRCGGLPQKPKPPLFYKLVFNIEGLTKEYTGKAYVLRKGKITQIDALTELEEIELPEPLGRCEAFITSGGTSTCPWTFKGQLDRYEYKTVRYPGHYERIKAIADLGLLSTEPIRLGDVKVVPREIFHKVVAPRMAFPDDKDLVVLRVSCIGEAVAGRAEDKKRFEALLDVMDFYDEKTGFSAMERTTGFAASIVAIMLAQGKIEKGAVPLEKAIPAEEFVKELAHRGISLTETIKKPIM